LFLIETISGTFSFSAAEKPLTDSVQSTHIDSSGGDRLIVALQYRDEFNALRAQMPPPTTKIKPVAAKLNWNSDAPEHLASLANRVWDVVSKRPLTIGELYRQCSACELKVYMVVQELLQSKQIATVDETTTPAPPPPRPLSQPTLQEPMAYIEKLP
jgi:hypothetical protein